MKSLKPAGSAWVYAVGMLLVIGLGGTVLFRATAASPVLFAPAPTTTTSSQGVSVVAGDFNGDGKLDLAVATKTGDVSVFLGNGDGTFRARINSVANADPGAMVAGDFNGDGKLDLVVANQSGGISVLLGNGDGTFQPASHHATGCAPLGLTAGDWNGDGNLDLVIANGQEGIVVLLGKGDGTFGEGQDYATNGTAESVAAGDLNGDGRVDLVVANRASGVTVLLGKGDGTFQRAAGFGTDRDPQSVALGDFNGDGKLDVVTTAGDGSVNVWLGNGDGSLRAPVSYPAGANPQSVVAADFNGDGTVDVLVTTSAGVSLLLGSGDGTLQAPTVYAANGATGPIAVGDFRGTGALGVAVLSGSKMNLLLNQGSGFNHSATGFPLTGVHAALPCAQCHVNNVFAGTPTACWNCHQAAYNGTTNPPHLAAGFPQNCSICHTTVNWTGATFNHAVSGNWPLTGFHATLSCTQCHVNNNYGLTSSACWNCHQTDYNNTTNPPHKSSGFPQDCSICHTTVDWTGATFNHSATGFPLTGAHATLQCAQCHVNNLFAGTPTACWKCHQTDYNNTTNPPHKSSGFPQDCSICHTTVNWTGATFNHAVSGNWPLTGFHATLSCTQCHVNNNYGLTSSACWNCHQTDYNNTTNPPHKSSGFPRDCSICHSTTSWAGAT